VGNANVAIDWVDLGTDNYTRLMQGYYDTVALRAARTSLRALDIVNRYDPEIQDTAAKRIRVARWFSRDEGTESRGRPWATLACSLAALPIPNVAMNMAWFGIDMPSTLRYTGTGSRLS